jgi:hypothetical protein
MTFAARNTNMGTRQQTDVGTALPAIHIQLYSLTVKAADADGIYTLASGAAAVDLTTGFSQPLYPVNLTVTPASGTNVTVTITGTDVAGNAISEGIATGATSTTLVAGTKAFATITRIQIPARGGAGETVTIGTGSKLGLPDKCPHNTVIAAAYNNVRETTAPTVTASATEFSGNTVTLNTSLADDKVVDVYYLV